MEFMMSGPTTLTPPAKQPLIGPSQGESSVNGARAGIFGPETQIPGRAGPGKRG